MEGECLVEMRLLLCGGGWAVSAPVLANLELHDRMLPGGGKKVHKEIVKMAFFMT